MFVFMLQEPAFALDASAVACEGAVGSDDAVTGDDYSDGVGAVGESDGPDGFRPADLFGQLSIGDGCAVWNLSQRAPDLALKWRASCAYRELVYRGKLSCEVTLHHVG